MATMSLYFGSSIKSVTVHANNNYYPKTFKTSGKNHTLSNLPSSGNIWIVPSNDVEIASGYTTPINITTQNPSGSWKLDDNNYVSIKDGKSMTLTATKGSGGGKILTVGSWPSILSSVSVTSGTFTSNNNAIPFSKTQYIESIQLTNAAKSNYWTGTLYWGTSSGSTTHKIATISGGNVTYNPSIESIDYSGSSRSIYFTAVGSYCYRVRYNANGGSFSSTTANFRDDFVE